MHIQLIEILPFTRSSQAMVLQHFLKVFASAVGIDKISSFVYLHFFDYKWIWSSCHQVLGYWISYLINCASISIFQWIILSPYKFLRTSTVFQIFLPVLWVKNTFLNLFYLFVSSFAMQKFCHFFLVIWLMFSLIFSALPKKPTYFAPRYIYEPIFS